MAENKTKQQKINAVTKDLKLLKEPTKNETNVYIKQGFFTKQAEHPGEPNWVSILHPER